MTSITDLCNRALGEIGTRSTITSLSEPSAEAINCSLFYDSLRRKLLRSAPWGFARTQLSLTLLGSVATNDNPFAPWQYMYAYPSDAVKIRFVSAQQQSGTVDGLVITGDQLILSAPATYVRFAIANQGNPSRKVILTNAAGASATYNRDEANPDMFDAEFEDALVSSLAAKLVIPLTGETGMLSGFVQLAQDAVMSARLADANEGVTTINHTPDWLLARNGYAQSEAQFGYLREGWDNLSFLR